MRSSGKKSSGKSSPGRDKKSSSSSEEIRGSISSSGKHRAITEFEYGTIAHTVIDWPPVMKELDARENGLNVFSKHWGIEAKVTGPVGAKNPTTFRSVTSTADAGSIYKKQPNDPYWNDIRDRKWQTLIYKAYNINRSSSKKDIDDALDSVSICALTGLPFMPSEDGDDLDHIESAKRTALMGIPISTFNYKPGRAWDEKVLVTHTIPEANRSAGAGSYFDYVQQLTIGRLTMMVNKKAKLEELKGVIIDGQQCYSLKSPFIEVRRISPSDIKELLIAVNSARNKRSFSKVLSLALDSINLDEHINAHIENLNNWPALAGILKVLNTQICVDLNTLFTGSRIQLGGKPLKTNMDIENLPTVGHELSLMNPRELNRESTIYLLPPFGKINSLAFLSQRFNNLEGSQFKDILEMIYNIGVGKGIGQGKHRVSTYIDANVTHGGPKQEQKPKTPTPPKEDFNLNNPDHLSVIQQDIHNWLMEPGNRHASTDKYLIERQLMSISQYKLDPRIARTVKNYIRDMIEAERIEIRNNEFRNENERLITLIKAIDKIGAVIGSSESSAHSGISSSQTADSGMSSSPRGFSQSSQPLSWPDSNQFPQFSQPLSRSGSNQFSQSIFNQIPQYSEPLSQSNFNYPQYGAPGFNQSGFNQPSYNSNFGMPLNYQDPNAGMSNRLQNFVNNSGSYTGPGKNNFVQLPQRGQLGHSDPVFAFGKQKGMDTGEMDTEEMDTGEMGSRRGKMVSRRGGKRRMPRTVSLVGKKIKKTRRKSPK